MFQFKKAQRKGVHVILGFMGGTGSGKTYSALEIATGLAGGRQFALIDTEAGRALQYADYFDFQHGDMSPPFSPAAYLEAILAAEKAGYPVIVVDSMSHEHAGAGGILDMHDQEHARLGGRDSTKMLAWVKPKTEHKRMVSRLLQLRAHLILCFRAEPKVKMVKVAKNGRESTEIVDAGWQPICAKGLEFEMAASFMLSNERPGFIGENAGQATKLPRPLHEMFSGEYLLNRTHGESVARWATGSTEQSTGTGGPPDDPPERSWKQVFEEDYPGMTLAEINRLLADADLKPLDGPFPIGTTLAEVKAVLDEAVPCEP